MYSRREVTRRSITLGLIAKARNRESLIRTISALRSFGRSRSPDRPIVSTASGSWYNQFPAKTRQASSNPACQSNQSPPRCNMRCGLSWGSNWRSVKQSGPIALWILSPIMSRDISQNALCAAQSVVFKCWSPNWLSGHLVIPDAITTARIPRTPPNTATMIRTINCAERLLPRGLGGGGTCICQRRARWIKTCRTVGSA